MDDVGESKNRTLRIIVIRFGIYSIAAMFVVAGIMLSLQNNEKKARKKIDTDKILDASTSFGNIGEVDYYMQQNALEKKIEIIQIKTDKKIENIDKKITEQTSIIKEHLNLMNEQQNKNIQTALKSLEEKVDKKIEKLTTTTNSSIAALEKKVDKKIKNIKVKHIPVGNLSFPKIDTKDEKPKLILKDGQVSFSDTKDEKPKIKHYKIIPQNNLLKEKKDINSSDAKDEYYEEEVVEYFSPKIETLDVSTLEFDEETTQAKAKSFEADLPVGLVRVTLLNGFKAPTLDIGVSNPVPVLMSIEGDVYLGNDYITNLKGCFIKGTSFGNINTRRAEVFGTQISCVLVGKNGIKYKIDQKIPENQIWIMGEDGGTGIPGTLVDSSGKILSQTVAMGFLDGMANYFAAQAKPTTGGTLLAGGTATSVPNMGASIQNGMSGAVSKSFDLIIKQYEKLLGGYFPFIDVKGGRKNLTAFLGGNIKLKFEPFVDPNIDIHRENNFAIANQSTSENIQK